jgi:hypothetical protein
MEAAQQVLEAEDTSPSVLSPLLVLLRAAVAAAPAALASRLHDLLDLLLGWSLDAGVTDGDR